MALHGQVALITGGGSGIGRAAALRLAAEGATVALVGRRSEPLEETAALVADTGAKAVPICADLTAPDAGPALAAAVLDRCGRVDIGVHNAGFSSSVRSARYLELVEWNDVLAVNLTGPAMLTRSLLPHMVERGSGTLILVSSVAAIRPSVMAGAAYGAAKAAAFNYMQELAGEVRNLGIRCTTVLPGEVDTAILDRRALPPDRAARSTMLTPEDVADVIAMIACLPQRATVDEVVITPTFQRDLTEDVAAALAKGGGA